MFQSPECTQGRAVSNLLYMYLQLMYESNITHSEITAKKFTRQLYMTYSFNKLPTKGNIVRILCLTYLQQEQDLFSSCSAYESLLRFNS